MTPQIFDKTDGLVLQSTQSIKVAFPCIMADGQYPLDRQSLRNIYVREMSSMRSTFAHLAAVCLLLVFAPTSWADLPEAAVTIFGQVGGRDGVSGSDYFVSPGSQIDIDPNRAEVLSYNISGGDGVNTGSVTAAAYAGRTPAAADDPAILGMDLVGSLTAARQSTGGASFFPAGNMDVSVSATAQLDDEMTISIPGGAPPGEIYTMEGIVYLHGFTSLEAVASGGIDPNNVRARVTGTFSSGEDDPFPTFFGAEKRATGDIIIPAEPALNILDLNPALVFSYAFAPDVPFPISLKLEVSGSASFGDQSFTSLSPGFAFASFEAHYGNTLSWGGITKIYNRSTGEEVTDYSVTSASGFDYSQTFPIPEPSSVTMLSLGGGLLLPLLRRRKA